MTPSAQPLQISACLHQLSLSPVSLKYNLLFHPSVFPWGNSISWSSKSQETLLSLFWLSSSTHVNTLHLCLWPNPFLLTNVICHFPQLHPFPSIILLNCTSLSLPSAQPQSPYLFTSGLCSQLLIGWLNSLFFLVLSFSPSYLLNFKQLDWRRRIFWRKKDHTSEELIWDWLAEREGKNKCFLFSCN
jgi:hypothetical protein